MTIKRTFAITTILASIVMVAISGTTQSVYAQLFSDAIPPDADVLLVELMDGSSSIIATDFTLQKDGLIAGLQATYDALAANPDPKQNLFGESYIIVIQFSTLGTQTVECSQEIDNQANLDALKTCIGGITQIAGSTCMSCAFNLAVTELANVPAEFLDPNDDVQIIDLITDGVPFPESQATALAAEDAAIAAGYDRVVALGVGAVDATFLASIVDPNPPGPINPGVLPEDDGFVITVANFAEFAPALERKLLGTIGDICDVPIPPPECVGGEFLPIDSTALLIAGMSANLGFIVPIAAGIAGVGAYLIRSRMNKD